MMPWDLRIELFPERGYNILLIRLKYMEHLKQKLREGMEK